MTGGWIISGVELTQLTQRRVIPKPFLGAPAENDMIENLDFQKLTRADQVARYFDIRFRRSGIAAGMIVHQDDGRGVARNGCLEHLARMHQDCVQRTLGKTVLHDTYSARVL